MACCFLIAVPVWLLYHETNPILLWNNYCGKDSLFQLEYSLEILSVYLVNAFQHFSLTMKLEFCVFVTFEMNAAFKVCHSGRNSKYTEIQDNCYNWDQSMFVF